MVILSGVQSHRILGDAGALRARHCVGLTAGWHRPVEPTVVCARRSPSPVMSARSSMEICPFVAPDVLCLPFALSCVRCAKSHGGCSN